MPHALRWMLALAGCAIALAGVRAPAPADARSGIRPDAVADTTCAPYEPAPTPAELRPFITEGKRPLCVAAADLDGDGREDYVLVLGHRLKSASPDASPAEDADEADKDDPRTLLLLIRQPDGALRVAARTERAVLCARCGGLLGDPFEGVAARPGAFTVYHYGGSAWRWRADYTFAYLPATGRWRLASVSDLSHGSLQPQTMVEHLYTAPEHFGDIDLAAFDHATWRAPGAVK